ncbi:MAG: hypothetical protein PHD54_04015 [Desulfuromonadaceae bacterium]|nr:hypothetical protein [Desulfuromonadaceae bacterium]
MGFLSNLFGGAKLRYPELDPADPAAARIKQVQSSLEGLVGRVNESLEVVPVETGAFVYIGEPPNSFGMAWLQDGKFKTFKALGAEKGVTDGEMTDLQEQMRLAYEHHKDDPRFSTKVAGREVVVASSAAFEKEIEGKIGSFIH